MKKLFFAGILALLIKPCLAQFTGAGCLYETTGYVGIGIGGCPSYNLFVLDRTGNGTNVLFGGTNAMIGTPAITGEASIEIQSPSWSQLVLTTVGTSSTDIFDIGTDNTYHYLLSANTQNATKPLLIDVRGGTVHAMTIWPDGKVGIGTYMNSLNNTRLAIEGVLSCNELKVITSGSTWPDFVFNSEFRRMSLSDVEMYINQNRHLPQLPPAAEIEKNGQYVGRTQAQILQAVEELYLHVIDLKKDSDALKAETETVKQRISKLEKEAL